MSSWLASLVFLVILNVRSIAASSMPSARIDALVRKWSPLVWLAPNEKFMPDSIEAFLPNTQPGDYYGRMISKKEIIEGDHSTKLYLHTMKNIDDLLANETNSFLHGRNPSVSPVPVYALVTKCSPNNFHVTYWLFFPFSLGKEFCVVGSIPLPHVFTTCLGRKMFLGSHVGDYEHLSMSFKAGSSYPQQVYLGTHESGVYYTLDRSSRTFRYTEQIKRKLLAPKPSFPHEIRMKDGRIEVFAAHGSHGLWAQPGNHSYHRFLGIKDVNGFGTPWRTWQDLQIYHVHQDVHNVYKRSEEWQNNVNRNSPLLPKWMFYEGRWGNPRSHCLLWQYFCAITDGPPGILRPVKDFYCDKI